MSDKKFPGAIDAKEFLYQLRRYQKGSVSRRHFLGVTGLGMATSVMAAAMPGLGRAGKAWAAGNIGDRVSIATWPNYYDPANYEQFTADTGAAVEIALKLQALLAARPDINEIEINPLILRRRGAVAVDALIRKEAP